MKFLALPLAFLVCVALVHADDCTDVCGLSCQVGNQICMLNPLDLVCAPTNALCTQICTAGCACLSECVTKCPAPELAAGATAVLKNGVALAGNTACKLSCRATCGLTVGTTAASGGVDIVTQMIGAIVGAGGAK